MSKLKPGYPFNNLKGKVCSGNGIHSSLLTNKENSLHVVVVVLCIGYVTFGIFFKLKVAKVFKRLSPGGSGRVFNSKYRLAKHIIKSLPLKIFRRNFLSFDETFNMIFLYIFSTILSRWFIFQLFLNTEFFSGPDQFLILILLYLILDLYFMMYCPYTWIKKSKEANWIGWSDGRLERPEKYFYFVRKPDPLEELKIKGYFKPRPEISRRNVIGSMTRITHKIQTGKGNLTLPVIDIV